MEAQRPQITKAILSQKINAKGNIIPDFKIYYSHSHENSMVLVRNRHLDQWNGRPTQLHPSDF
jgi:hypothetical protein